MWKSLITNEYHPCQLDLTIDIQDIRLILEFRDSNNRE